MIQISENGIITIIGSFIFQAFVSYIIGYVYGAKSERRQAILHGLAEWIPYKDGTPVFVWRDHLPSKLQLATDQIEDLNRLLSESDLEVKELRRDLQKLKEKRGKPDVS